MIIAACLLAAWIPAARAAKVDPDAHAAAGISRFRPSASPPSAACDRYPLAHGAVPRIIIAPNRVFSMRDPYGKESGPERAPVGVGSDRSTGITSEMSNRLEA